MSETTFDIYIGIRIQIVVLLITEGVLPNTLIPHPYINKLPQFHLALRFVQDDTYRSIFNSSTYQHTVGAEQFVEDSFFHHCICLGLCFHPLTNLSVFMLISCSFYYHSSVVHTA